MGRKKLYPFNKCMRGYVANGILNFTDSAFFVLNKICGIYPRQHILERNKNQYLLTSLEMELKIRTQVPLEITD